ncbi:MAG: hypothetical protein ACE5IJ_08805 [Thermoplasmata archaeon]
MVILEYYNRNRGKDYFLIDRPVGETGVVLDGGHFTCSERDIWVDSVDDTFRIPLVEGLAHPPASEKDPRFSPEQMRMQGSGKRLKEFVESGEEGMNWRDFLFGAAAGGLIFFILSNVLNLVGG